MADNLDVKDAASATKTLRFIDNGSGVLIPAHVIVDSTGAVLIGTKAMAASLPVTLPSDMALTGRSILTPVSSFSRPANTTPYVIGYTVADNTVAASVSLLSFTAARFSQGAGKVRRARLSKSDPSLTNAQFRLHLFSSSPTLAAGDGAAISFSGAGATPTWLGYIDLTCTLAFTDGAMGIGTPGQGTEIDFKLSSGTALKGVLEARAAYTPVSTETFAVALEVETT